MAYTINKTDGSIQAIIADGSVNTDTLLYLFGRNFIGHGELMNENLVRLLENGAYETAPPNPLVGQTWYDKNVDLLKVFNGVEFRPLGGAISAPTAPSGNNNGDLWWNTASRQLFVWDANTSSFVLVGPMRAGAYGVTGAIPKILIDTLDNEHVVIELTTDNVVVAIVSKDPLFTLKTPTPEFTVIGPGFNMATDGGNPRLLRGTATNSLSLGGFLASDFLQLAASGSQSMASSLNINNDSGLRVGTGNDLRLSMSGTTPRVARIENATANGTIVVSTTGAPTAVTIANNGNVTLTGSLAASGLSGNGAGLSNLNASSLASGIVPNGRLAGPYTGLLGLSGTGTVSFTQFVGGGAGLTSLNAGALSTGTIPSARLNASTYNNLVTIQGTGSATFGSFSGNGSALTALHAPNISTGTVAAARLPSATTSAQGITQLNDTLVSTSTTQALTANAGKVLQDSKQATLVSGTNIKTVGGESILGSGNITSTAPLFHAQDQKPSGTAGGTFTSGSWQVRTLNTVLTNEIPGASLSSNQITLPAGTYYAEARGNAFRATRNRLRLRIASDDTTLVLGHNANARNASDSDARTAHLSGRFTLPSTSILEVTHRGTNTQATNGYGTESSFGVPEIYVDIRIWKIS